MDMLHSHIQFSLCTSSGAKRPLQETLSVWLSDGKFSQLSAYRSSDHLLFDYPGDEIGHLWRGFISSRHFMTTARRWPPKGENMFILQAPHTFTPYKLNSSMLSSISLSFTPFFTYILSTILSGEEEGDTTPEYQPPDIPEMDVKPMMKGKEEYNRYVCTAVTTTGALCHHICKNLEITVICNCIHFILFILILLQTHLVMTLKSQYMNFSQT